MEREDGEWSICKPQNALRGVWRGIFHASCFFALCIFPPAPIFFCHRELEFHIFARLAGLGMGGGEHGAGRIRDMYHESLCENA